MKVTRLTLLLAAGCLLGCTGQASAAVMPASVTPSVVAPASHRSVTQLRDAAVAAGYDCPSWVQTDMLVFAAETGNCTDRDTFLTFDGDNDANMMIDRRRDDGFRTHLLVGPNWIINTSNDLDALQAGLGGRIVRG